MGAIMIRPLAIWLVLVWTCLAGVLPSVAAERWIFLSDIHIGETPDRLHRKRNVTNNFRWMTKEVLALEPKVDGILITGDLAVSRGESGDYRHLKELLAPLVKEAIPLHLLVGNHDDRENMVAVIPEPFAKSCVAGRVCYLIETPHADFICLDSKTSNDDSQIDLGDAQRAWLDEVLATNGDKPAVLFAHHPPFLLQDRAAVVGIVKKHPRVKVFVFGHTHYPGFIKSSPLIPLSLINLIAMASGSGESNSFGYTEVLLTDEGMTLTIHTGEPDMPENGKVWTVTW